MASPLSSKKSQNVQSTSTPVQKDDRQPPQYRPRREIKFAPVNLAGVDSEGSFSGYASLFDIPDLGRDVVRRGAFRDSLQKRGVKGVKMLFQHDPAQPIGLWEDIREDHRGLWVRGRLLPDLARAREILSLMRAGALDGLSIGFQTLKARRDRTSGLRQLLKVDLWEISIVTFPMLSEARVAQVKGGPFMNGFPTLREFERWLVRDAGFSRSQARTISRSGFTALQPVRDASLGAIIRKSANRIRAAS